MDRRTRICLWIIVLGLGNFLVYTVLYIFIDGEAVNGWVEAHQGHRHYFLQSGTQVNRDVFLYSGIHSISIWITVAAVMLAMLTLAKDRIISSMHRAIVRGRTFITILATVITLTTAVATVYFTLIFARNLAKPKPPPASPVSMPSGRPWR
jgi:heme/copper-type cytochrome/quinol oxidase subunit 2